jgi:hypothetical protein
MLSSLTSAIPVLTSLNFHEWVRKLESYLPLYGTPGLAVLNKIPIIEPAYPEETMRIKDCRNQDTATLRYSREPALLTTDTNDTHTETVQLIEPVHVTRSYTAATQFSSAATATNPTPVPTGTVMTAAATSRLASDIDQWHKDCAKLISDNGTLMVIIWNSVSVATQQNVITHAGAAEVSYARANNLVVELYIMICKSQNNISLTFFNSKQGSTPYDQVHTQFLDAAQTFR